MAQLYQRVGVPTKAKDELRSALDFAQTTEEKKIARDLLRQRSGAIFGAPCRPDFAALLRRARLKK